MNGFWVSAGLIWKDTKVLLALAIGLLAPIKGLLIIIGIFILIDTVLGVLAAKKRKIKITSNRLSSMLSKMLVYQLVVILAFALDKLILGDIVAIFISVPLLITKIAALFVLANEAYSIDEKIRIVRNGKGIWYQFKRLIGTAKLIKKETKDLDIEEVGKKILLKEGEHE